MSKKERLILALGNIELSSDEQNEENFRIFRELWEELDDLAGELNRLEDEGMENSNEYWLLEDAYERRCFEMEELVGFNPMNWKDGEIIAQASISADAVSWRNFLGAVIRSILGVAK